MKFPRISIFEAILGFCFRCRVVDFGYVGQSHVVAFVLCCSDVGNFEFTFYVEIGSNFTSAMGETVI